MLALGAACFDSVSLSGASKTLGVGYLCSQLAQGFSAVKAKVVFEGQCGFGDIRDQGELRMKEAIWEGDFVVSVVPREVKGGVWEAGCEIWVARCDLGEGAVMGEGCLSLLILVDGFPHNSYLPFCFLPQAQVALCCKQVLTLGSVGGVSQARDAKWKLGSSGQCLRKCHLSFLVCELHTSGTIPSSLHHVFPAQVWQHPTFLFPTYFNFSSLFLCFSCFSLSFPTPPLPPPSPAPPRFLEQSCLSSCLYQALPSSPWGKTAAEPPSLELIPCLGSRIPSQTHLFPHFPKPCLSTSAPSLQGRAHQAQGPWATSSGGPQSLWARGLWGLLKSPECLLGGCRSSPAPLQSR